MRGKETQAIEATETELLRQMSQGDEEAFAELFRRHYVELHQFAFHMTGLAGTAEEVVIEVFVNLLREWTRFRSSNVPLRFLLLRTACASVMRHCGKRPEKPEESVTSREQQLPASSAPQAELNPLGRIERIRRAILNIPFLYREALVLCEIQGLSHIEAANLLSCSLAEVRSRLRQARSLLLGQLSLQRLSSLTSSP